MKRIFIALILATGILRLQAAPLADRFVWIFGWDLGQDRSIAEITNLIATASQHGINGAVMSGFDSLCKRSPEDLQRLKQIQTACEQHHVELIPALFSIGYGGEFLGHNRNLAEGLPVRDARFRVQSGGVAQIDPDPTAHLSNGGFEEFKGTKLPGFNFYDHPGEIGFIDTNVAHSGKASLRMEHFTANPHGHGRVMQEIKVTPHRSYRFTLWAKAEKLEPRNCFRVLVLAGDRDIAPREFRLNESGEWQKITLVFNSLEFDKVRIYAGVWGGKTGRFWLDDGSVEEVGLVNPLRRPGTPIKVQNSDGSVTYTEGSDFLGPKDNPVLWRDDIPQADLKIPAGSRIREGDVLRVSWYHSMLIHDSQVTACMAEPQIYEIIEHEAKLLAEHFHPRRVLLSMDEVRMGGTCEACKGRDMGELVGQCVTRQAESIRRYVPGAQIYVWSDMFDPKHNAHGDYYLVQGNFTGSWNHIPKDVIVAVWGGEPRPESLQFFSNLGFETLGACYYDADDLKDTKVWLDQVRKTPKARGLMYTPWERKYSLLPAFGDMLSQP
jgi:hypothetical protein